jgi:hypothetical protein
MVDSLPRSQNGDSDSERAAKQPRLDAHPACDTSGADHSPIFHALPGFQLHADSSRFPTKPELCKPTNPLSIRHPEGAKPVVRDFLMRQQQSFTGQTMGVEAKKTAALNTLMALLEDIGTKSRKPGAGSRAPLQVMQSSCSKALAVRGATNSPEEIPGTVPAGSAMTDRSILYVQLGRRSRVLCELRDLNKGGTPYCHATVFVTSQELAGATQAVRLRLVPLCALQACRSVMVPPVLGMAFPGSVRGPGMNMSALRSCCLCTLTCRLQGVCS